MAKWRKLRRASAAELGDRARQWLAAWSERMRISGQSRQPSDRKLAEILSPVWAGSWASTAAAALERFRTRTAPCFFAAFDERADVLAELRGRWPEAQATVTEYANRLGEGRFDFLGRSRLDYGRPIDWQRDPISGLQPGPRHWSRIDHLDPRIAGEYKLIWELNRHQYFAALGKAYWYTGDERYAATFVAHLLAWLEANPPKRGVNWASSLEVSFRAIAWIWALHFFRTSPRLTDAVFLRALTALYVHGRHIETYLSTYSSPNTHLTGEALGLIYLGTLFPEFDCAERWRRIGWTTFVEQLNTHVRPDGSYFEQSTYYHRYTTDFCLHALILARRNGTAIGAPVAEKLRALLDQLLYLTQPDGRTALVGDDDGGRLLALDDRSPNDFRAALATGAVLFQRPDYRYVAGEVSEETLWLLGPDGVRMFDALDRVAPAAGSRAFGDGGYYVLRDGWERNASSMVIDCGPHGVLNCGHAHADALSFTLVARGKPVLVDPGTYTYTSPLPLRDHFRSSAAHNTVTVAGESSSVPQGPFSWGHIARSSLQAWYSGERFDYFEGSHDGYARLTPPAVHCRAVLFVKGDYWIIRDTVRSAGNREVDVHLHFAPGISVAAQSPSRAVARWETADSLEIGVFGPPGVLRAVEQCASSSYGALSRTRSCVFSARAGGDLDVVTFLVPRARSEESLIVREHLTERGRAFTIVGRGVEDTLLLGDGGEATSEDVSTDAKWAWVRARREEAGPLEFLVVQGTRLTWRGHRLVHADQVTTHAGRLAALAPAEVS